MASPDFIVDRIEPDGTVVGRNAYVEVPVGTVFTSICKTRLDGELPDLISVELGVIAEIELALQQVQIFRSIVRQIPSGYSAGLQLSGTGMQVLATALSKRGAREYVHLRA